MLKVELKEELKLAVKFAEKFEPLIKLVEVELAKKESEEAPKSVILSAENKTNATGKTDSLVTNNLICFFKKLKEECCKECTVKGCAENECCNVKA